MVEEATPLLIFLIDCGLDLKNLYIPISTNIQTTSNQDIKINTHLLTINIQAMVKIYMQLEMRMILKSRKIFIFQEMNISN